MSISRESQDPLGGLVEPTWLAGELCRRDVGEAGEVAVSTVDSRWAPGRRGGPPTTPAASWSLRV